MEIVTRGQIRYSEKHFTLTVARYVGQLVDKFAGQQCPVRLGQHRV